MNPQRLQMSRQKPWRADNPDAVIVARPSRWGNPFPVKDYGLDVSLALFRDMIEGVWNPTTFGQHHADAEYATVYLMRSAWLRRVGGHPTEMIRGSLVDADLACWCPLDSPCHADALLEIANS